MHWEISRCFGFIRIFAFMDRGEIIIYQTADGETRLDVRMENDSVWLTQAQMVELFNSTKQNVSLHINNIFKEGELEREATVKEYLIVRQEGNRSVRRKITYLGEQNFERVPNKRLCRQYPSESRAVGGVEKDCSPALPCLGCEGGYEIRGGRATARDYGLYLWPRHARSL